MASLHHASGGRLSREKATQTADTPTALEVGRIDFEDPARLVDASIEHYQTGGTEVAFDPLEERRHGPRVGSIAGITPHTGKGIAFEQCIKPLFAARRHGHLHARRGEALDQGPTQARAYAYHHCYFSFFHSLPASQQSVRNVGGGPLPRAGQH